MQQGGSFFSREGRYQLADSENWGSMKAFPSEVQELQTELLENLHNEGCCDRKYDPHSHHNPHCGPHTDQQLYGRLGIGLLPQTFGSPINTEDTLRTHSPAGEGPCRAVEGTTFNQSTVCGMADDEVRALERTSGTLSSRRE